MNTVWEIINKPYVIALILAIVITLFTYFVILKKNPDDEEESNPTKICIYTFIISYFGILVLLYVFDMLKKSKPIQTGGGDLNSGKDVITAQDLEGLEMTGEDVDIGILENN